MRFAMAILLWLCISVCGFSASSYSAPRSCSSPEYDIRIAAAVAKWWRDVDPRTAVHAWKAQLCQESRLDPTAKSPVGAKGLAQFMDGTWSEEAPKAGHADASAFDADAAIDVGAAYMASLRRFWRAAVDPDRHRLAQGSYNAGPGSIRSASRLCGGALTWSVVITCLPAVTGSHAAETINYVDRIAIWQRQLGNVR